MKAIFKNLDDFETKEFCSFIESLEEREEITIPYSVTIIDEMTCDLEFDCSLFEVSSHYMHLPDGWFEFSYEGNRHDTYAVYMDRFNEITFR